MREIKESIREATNLWAWPLRVASMHLSAPNTPFLQSVRRKSASLQPFPHTLSDTQPSSETDSWSPVSDKEVKKSSCTSFGREASSKKKSVLYPSISLENQPTHCVVCKQSTYDLIGVICKYWRNRLCSQFTSRDPWLHLHHLWMGHASSNVQGHDGSCSLQALFSWQESHWSQLGRQMSQFA